MTKIKVAMLPDESQALDPACPKHPPPPDFVHSKDPAFPPESSTTIPAITAHQYKITSRGRDFALIAVMSRARNAHDPPFLYFGEELKGFIEVSLDDLNGVWRMEVVVSPFPTYRGIIAIQPGARSCRCMILTQLSHRVRPSAYCYHSRATIPTSREVDSAGPFPLRPCRRSHPHPGVHPQLLFHPPDISPPM
jgi:hypothetical protein